MKNQVFTKQYNLIIQIRTIVQAKDKFVLHHTDSFIWNYMYVRYEFFKSLGKEYFESALAISEATSCSINTVSRTLAKLKKSGIIQVKKQKVHGMIHKNIYTVKYPTQLSDVLLLDKDQKLIKVSNYELTEENTGVINMFSYKNTSKN